MDYWSINVYVAQKVLLIYDYSNRIKDHRKFTKFGLKFNIKIIDCVNL